MIRIALLAALSSACTTSTLVGASTMTAAALATSAAERKAGGCYAICTGDTACNPRNGLCEKLPCGGRCGPDEHCEASYTESKCAPGAPSDVAARAPGTKAIPLLPPPAPTPSGPPQVVPAAEQNPPSSGNH